MVRHPFNPSAREAEAGGSLSPSSFTGRVLTCAHLLMASADPPFSTCACSTHGLDHRIHVLFFSLEDKKFFLYKMW